MKTLFASIIFLVGLISSAFVSGGIQNTYKKTSLVIVKLDKPNSATVSKAVALTAKYHGMSHEYSCSTSGIIVYRYNHNLNERDNVIQFFQKI